MKTYYFEVTETASKIVSVKAEDFDEAYELVDEAFNSGKNEITWDDFLCREIEDKTEDVKNALAYGIDFSFVEEIE